MSAKLQTQQERAIQIIRAVAAECGGLGVRDDYSGRGMYGARCWAIVCDDPDTVIETALRRGLRYSQTDDMGRGSIVYWPKVGGVA